MSSCHVVYMSSANTSPNLRAEYNGSAAAETSKPLIFQRFVDDPGIARGAHRRIRYIL